MKYFVKIPDFLLPKKEISLKKWSVVACDQYTSEPEYWNRVEKYVGDSPSTYNIVYPEAYLENRNMDERINSISKHMQEYMINILENVKGFVLIDRMMSHGKSRKGLLVCIDLDEYDYTPHTSAPIRATEGTVLDRLPPRIKIRQNACLETPHILFLIDDNEKTVIEPLFDKLGTFHTLYDFDLMENSGHITGYLIDDESLQKDILSKLQVLEKDGFNFAVGDGNHSLATAKEIWKKISVALSENEKISHPARYALGEVVNVFDEGLEFKPIHRILFNANDFLDTLDRYTERKYFITKDIIKEENVHNVQYLKGEETGYINFFDPDSNLCVGTLQKIIDRYIQEKPGSKVDYIHGSDVVKKLSNENDIGFLHTSMRKEDLFETVKKDGVLPKKTFSMGEANEKRFYLECRKIKV